MRSIFGIIFISMFFTSCEGLDGGSEYCSQESRDLMHKWRNTITLEEIDLRNCIRGLNCEVQLKNNEGKAFCEDQGDFWLIHDDGSWRFQGCQDYIFIETSYNICANTLTIPNFPNRFTPHITWQRLY